METLSLLFAVFFLMANRMSSASQNHPDAFSLFAFRSHISADPFHVLANWTSETSACNWAGVSCGSRNGRVVALNVSGMSLGGSIAPNIANLTFLTSLDLSNNVFAGSIPAELYKCTHLEILSLSYNNLSGSIPTTLGYFENLKDLDIGGNALSGGIPWEIGNLTQLENINMGTNFLTGPIPSSIFNITTLRVMDFSNNSLSGSFQHNIYSNLRFLESLYLYTNQFSGPIPSFIWNCKSLQVLSLGDNVFTGSLSPSVANLTSLKYLHLQLNGLTGTIPSAISNASQIVEIVVLNNRLSGPIPDSIGNLRFLRRLFLGGNNLTRDESSSTHELTFITSLTNCRQLEHVEMSENQFNGFLPASVGNLSESLRVFNAFGSRITGSIPDEIGNMSSLQSINLDSNEFTGAIPSTIAKLSRLDRIYLEYNKLQGHIPAELCQLANLGDLYLNENMLSGPIPGCLGNLKSLRNVFLQSNNLTSTIPSSLWSLTDLLGLNLSSNSLSGAVSQEIQNLRAITQLDLSWNQISGVIPSSIGSSKTLLYLSLAQNSFQGGIPESLGNMVSLEYMDLSHNNITGSIPKALENLGFLKYLDLSFNKLEGEIPSGGCFSNFTAESYAQNNAMCGATRLHVQTCRLIRNPSPSKSKKLLLKYILPPIGCALLVAASVTAYMRGRRRREYMKPAHDQNHMSLPHQWLRFSYLDLFKATDSFSTNSLLGTGSFGSVFKAMFPDGLTVAVKVFHMQSEGVNKSFSAECIALASIRHRNIIKILSCVSTEAFKALVLEYMPNGSLESWLHSGTLFLDMLQRLNVAIDVASALDYLHHFHDPPIVHCDLKPSNILIDQDMGAHLTDFGMAKLFHEHELLMQTKTLATVGYMAPEYGTSGIVSTSGDVYSYGIVLLELFTRKRPTDDLFGENSNLRDWVIKSMLANSVAEVVDNNLIGQEEEQMLNAKKECVTDILGVGVECLSDSPQQRISFSDILARLTKIRATLS